MSCLYSTAIDTKLQELFTQNPQNLLQNSNSVSNFIKELEYYVSLLPEKLHRAVDYTVYLGAMCLQVYPTQTRIGYNAKSHRVTAHRHLQRAHKIGMLKKEFRGVKNTCLYEISEIFKIPKIRKALRRFFPSLKYMYKKYSTINSDMLSTSHAISSHFRGGATQDSISFSESNSLRTNLSISQIHPDIVTGDSKSARVYQQDGRTSNKIKSGRSSMSDRQQSEQAIRNVKSMRLSLRGKLRLTVFRAAAIQSADEVVMRSKAKDRFALFYSECLKWHKENGIAVDWGRSSELMARYQIAPDMPELEEGDQPQLKVRVSTRRTDSDTQYVPGSQKGDTFARYQADQREYEAQNAEEKKRLEAAKRLATFERIVEGLKSESQRKFYREILKNDLSFIKKTSEYAEACIRYGQEIADRMLHEALFEPETTGSASLRQSESTVNPAVFMDSSSGSNEMHFRKLGISGADTPLSSDNLNQELNLSDPAHAVSLPESPVSVSLVGLPQSGTRSVSQTPQDSTAVSRDFQPVNPLFILDGLVTGGRRDPAYGSNSNKNQRRLFEDSG